MRQNSLKNNNGFTFVEILVSIMIVSVLMLGIFGLMIFTLKITTDNSLRLMAIALANQKMEYVRSLPYNSVGIYGGALSGVIINDEHVIINNAHFTVGYFINYEDDLYDGVLPADTSSNDYKNVRITVSYNGPFGLTNVIVSTIVAPRNLEVCAPGHGTLAIQVLNNNGDPVPSASVPIANNAVTPPINDPYGQTDENGLLVFSCASSSDQSYQATTTKAGYSTDYTVAAVDPNFHPRIPYASILDDAITTVIFQIDLLSNLQIKTIHADLPNNFVVSHDPGTDNQTNSRIVVDGSGNIYVVWQDYRQSSKAKIRAQKFNPSGTPQWDTPDDPVIATMNDTTLPDITVDQAGNLYVAWDDESAGGKDSYLAKLDSDDGDRVWTGEKKVSEENSNQLLPRVALADDGSHATTTVIWQDDRDTDWDIYMKNYKPDGDDQWAEIRVNTDAIGNGKNQYEPVVDTDNNGNIYSAWTDDRNGNEDIYLEKYDLTGAKQLADDLKINNDSSTSAQNEPDIAINKNTNFIYVTWTDKRNGNKDIYIQKFDLNGTKQWTNDLMVNKASTSDQYSPSIAIDNINNYIYVIWTDDRNGNPDIYAQKLNGTDGAQLWTADVRVNINTDTSSQYNPDIVIDPTDNKPYATWYDDQKGNYDIFASKFDDYESGETAVGNVSLNIHGGKTLNLPPDTPNYKYNHSYTTDAAGNLNLNNIEWDSYYISTTTASTKAIKLTYPDLPINLAPGSSQTVKIYLED